MVEIRDIARNLECGAHGIWFNRKRTNVSYPEDGNLRCFAIEENSFWFKHRNRCIAEAIRLFPPRGVILDVGGGNGYVSLALQNSGLDVILLEPGYRGVLHGHTRGLRTTICSTLEDAGFKPHTIPAVGLFDVLEHVEHDVDFLRTLNTLLLPKRQLYVTVPAYSFLWSVDDRHAGHYRRFTLQSLAMKLGSAGFKIDLSTYIFVFLPIPIFLVRTLPSRLGLRRGSDLNRTRREHSERGS